MTDLRTAAQQALEVLEDWDSPVALPAITALRAALAQEQAEPVLQTCNCRWDGDVQVHQCTLHEAHVDALHEWAERAKTAEKKLAAMAQERAEPVQEPAFHGFMSADGTRVDLCFTPSSPRSDGTYATAYYTAPPQRKPLTEEEIAAEWQKASECASKSEGAVTTSQFVQMFARAIERAHGIPMPEAPACPDCHGVGYDASGQLCWCQQNPSF